MFHHRRLFGLALAVCLAACSSPTSPGELGLSVTSPPRGTLSSDGRVTVAGHVGNPSYVHSLTVNGAAIDVADDGSFHTELRLEDGLHFIETELTTTNDVQSDTRAVLAGALTPDDHHVPSSVHVDLAPDTVAVLARTAARVLSDRSFSEALADAPPVAQKGTGCFAVEVRLHDLEIGEVEIDALPDDDGLDTKIELNDLRVVLAVDYSVACAKRTALATATVSRYYADATIDLAADEGLITSRIEVHDSTATGFTVETIGVPDVDALLSSLDWAIGPTVGWLLQAQVGPTIASALTGVTRDEHKITLGDASIVLRTTADLLKISAAGAEIEVGTAAFAPGVWSPGFLSTSLPPSGRTSLAGYHVRIADELFQQTLAAMWSAGLIEQSVSAEDAGVSDFQGQLGSIKLRALLPPIVSFPDLAPARASIGDILVDALDPSGRLIVRLAVSATFNLNVVDSSGELTYAPVINLVTGSADLVEVGAGVVVDEDVVLNFADAALRVVGKKVENLIATVKIPSSAGMTINQLRASSKRGFIHLEGEIEDAM